MSGSDRPATVDDLRREMREMGDRLCARIDAHAENLRAELAMLRWTLSAIYVLVVIILVLTP